MKIMVFLINVYVVLVVSLFLGCRHISMNGHGNDGAKGLSESQEEQLAYVQEYSQNAEDLVKDILIKETELRGKINNADLKLKEFSVQDYILEQREAIRKLEKRHDEVKHWLAQFAIQTNTSSAPSTKSE